MGNVTNFPHLLRRTFAYGSADEKSKHMPKLASILPCVEGLAMTYSFVCKWVVAGRLVSGTVPGQKWDRRPDVVWVKVKLPSTAYLVGWRGIFTMEVSGNWNSAGGMESDMHADESHQGAAAPKGVVHRGRRGATSESSDS